MTRARSLLLLAGLACAWLVVFAAPARADDCARLIRSQGRAAVLRDPGVIQDCLRTGQNWGWIFAGTVGVASTGIALVGLPGDKGAEDADCAILAARYRAARNGYLTKFRGPDAELDRIVADVKAIDEARESGVKDWKQLDQQVDGLANDLLMLGAEITAMEGLGAVIVKGSQVALLATPQAQAVLANIKNAMTVVRAAGAGEAMAGGAAGGSTLGPLGALGGAIGGLLALVVAEIALEKVENVLGSWLTAERLKGLNARHAALEAGIQEAAVKRSNVKAGLDALTRSRQQKRADYDTRYTVLEKELTDLHADARRAAGAYFDAQCGSQNEMPDLPEHQPRTKEDLSYQPKSTAGQFLKWIGAVSYD